MKKRTLSMLLIFVLAFSLIPYSSYAESEYKSEYLNNLYLSPINDLGYPLKHTMLIDSAYSKEDGKNMLYTTASGKPAALVCYDIDNKKVVRELTLKGAKVSWSHGTDSKGNVYIATQSDARIFKWDVKEKKLYNLGLVDAPDGVRQTALYGVCFDKDDNAYVGTYPSAYLLKVDGKTGTYDFVSNELCPDEKYIRAVAENNGYIYCGGNSSKTYFSRINLETGNIEYLDMPDGEEVIKNFNGITPCGDYLICSVGTDKKRSLMHIYKISENKWLTDEKTAIPSFGFYATPVNDNKTYFHCSNTKTFYGFDLKEEKIFDTGIQGATIRKAHWYDFKDGKTLVTVQSNGSVSYVNFDKKTYTEVPTNAAPQPTEIRCLEPGPKGSNTVIISQYMGPKMGVLNDYTNDIYYIPHQQIEGMGEAHGEFYTGGYPGGNLSTIDFKNKKRNIFRSISKEKQDRIFNIIEAGDYVAAASYPDYGILGGAISIIDPKTKETTVYQNIIEDQTIVSIAYRDGKLYGTTSIWGGLGSVPKAKNAKLFIFDMEQRKVTKQRDLKLDGIDGDVLFAGKIMFSPKGELWAISKGDLFQINPKTLSIKKEIILDKCSWDRSQVTASPYKMHWVNDDFVIANPDDKIAFIDTKTGEYKILSQNKAGYMAVSENNNLYFCSPTRVQLFKLKFDISGKKNFIEEAFDSNITTELEKFEPIEYGVFGFLDDKFITSKDKEMGDVSTKELTFNGVSNISDKDTKNYYAVGGTAEGTDFSAYPQKIERSEIMGKGAIKVTMPAKGYQIIVSPARIDFDSTYKKDDTYKFVADVILPEVTSVDSFSEINVNENKVYGQSEMGCYITYLNDKGERIGDSGRKYLKPSSNMQKLVVDCENIPENAVAMLPYIYFTRAVATPGAYIINPQFYKYNENKKVDNKLNKSVILKLNNSDAYVNLMKYSIDKNNKDVVPYTINGRTLVPVRFIAEATGSEVLWDDATKKVTIKGNEKIITIVLNENKININGKDKIIDVPAITNNGRTMLPLRAVVESLGKEVFWDERGLIVITDNNVLDKTINKNLIDNIIKYFNK